MTTKNYDNDISKSDSIWIHKEKQVIWFGFEFYHYIQVDGHMRWIGRPEEIKEIKVTRHDKTDKYTIEPELWYFKECAMLG